MTVISVFCLAGSKGQRQSLERFVDSVPSLRYLGSGNLSSTLPAQADVILAEILPGETPQQSLQGPPHWLVLQESVEPGWGEVRGQLPRRCSDGELEAALVAVAQGLMVTHPGLATEVPPAPTPLSAREHEVLPSWLWGVPTKRSQVRWSSPNTP